MPSPTVRAAALVVMVTAAAAAGAGVAGGQAAPGDGATTIRIVLGGQGEAAWTVTLRFSLESINDTEAFDRLATAYEAGEADLLPAAPFREAASLAAAETGRPMAIENVTRTAGVRNGTGRLVLSFEWTNFTRTEDGNLELGDVFTTGDGSWLPALDDNQELIIEFPAGYAPQSSSHRLQNGTIHVKGPARFDPGEPSVTLLQTGNGTPDGPPLGEGWLPPVAGAAALVVLVGALVYFVRTRTGIPGESGSVTTTEPVDEGDDDPLLSDEERVLRLLHRNGGRMKQVDIVEATDWSNAKVSQLLTGMAADGRVEKLRIGRENLISLPERPPEEP